MILPVTNRSILVLVSDEPKWFQPGYKPPVTRRPSEPFWTVQKDGGQVTCELRDHGGLCGVEVQLRRDGGFYSGRLCDTRALALEHADRLRTTLERDGWTASCDVSL